MSDQAIRIFEALSDVDEELLERCARKAGRKNVTGLFQRYGRAMAAGICLIVVGAASWGGYHLITASSGADSSGAAQFIEGVPAELSDMANSIIAEDGDVNGTDGVTGSEYEMTGNGMAPAQGITENRVEDAGGAVADDWKPETGEAQMESALNAAATTTSPETAKQQTIQSIVNNSMSSGRDYAAEKVDKMEELRAQENALSDSREVIPWEEACALKPFAGYLPAVLPDGYEPFSARRSALPDRVNDVIFKWSDGENIFYMDMTQGEVVTKEELERRDGLYEYLAEDFRRELIPDIQPAGEPISFTLYYADGMRIAFKGYITADEMWDVVESISR